MNRTFPKPRFHHTASILGIALLINAAPAQAYLDPGTGSLMVQMLVGAVAAAGAALSVYWQRLRALFTRDARRPLPETSADEQEGQAGDTDGQAR